MTTTFNNLITINYHYQSKLPSIHHFHSLKYGDFLLSPFKKRKKILSLVSLDLWTVA